MVANHASYVDGLILLAALRERGYSFAAKRELTRSLLPRLFLRSIGTEFVERADIRQGVEDASRLAAAVRAGFSPVVFAEGTFTRSAGLLPFRMGAFRAARRQLVRAVRRHRGQHRRAAPAAGQRLERRRGPAR